MITATVNGNEIQFEKDKYETFKDFYEENKIPNKVLSKLKINDNEVPVSHLEEIYTANFEGEETIEMQFDDLIPFTLNLLGNLEQYLDKFEAALPNFAASIKTGDSKSIEGLQSLQEGVKALETMKSNLFTLTGTTEDDFNEFNGEREKLQTVLKEVNEAISNKDWEELSQQLEYDLPEGLDYYKRIFKKAEEILRQRKS